MEGITLFGAFKFHPHGLATNTKTKTGSKLFELLKRRLPQQQNKLYAPFFLTLTIVVVTTILLVTTVLYINFEKELSLQIYRSNLKNLEQIDLEVNNLANSAMTVSSQIFQDVTVAKLLYYSEPDIYDLGPALRQLSNYHFFIPSIDSIYVFNSNTGTLYIEGNTIGTVQRADEGFSDREVIRMIDHFRDYKPYIPIPRIYTDDNGFVRHYYTFLMYDMLTGENLNGAVVINVFADWIQDIIHEDVNGSEGDTFIIDGSGRVVSDSNRYPMLTDLSKEAHIQKILASSEDSNYFLTPVSGTASFVAFTKPDKLGWRYIRIIDQKQLFKNINQMRRISFFISFGLLAVGIGISFYISGRLSRPIGKMLNSIEKYEREERVNHGTVHQELMRDIALDRAVGARNSLEARCKQSNLQIALDEPIFGVLFKIDDYRTFASQYDIADRNLYRFAIMNIASELLGVFGRVETVDLGTDTVLAILSSTGKDHENQENRLTSNFLILKEPENNTAIDGKLLDAAAKEVVQSDDAGKDKENQAALVKQLERIRDEVNKHFQFSLSITYSMNSTDKFEQLSKLLPLLQESLRHRMFSGYGCILDANDILKLRNKQYVYPLNREKTMVDAMMAGKTDEALDHCLAIIADTENYPPMACSMTITHLAFTLNQAIHLIVTNNSHSVEVFVSPPQIMPEEVETLDEVARQFRVLFDALAVWLEEKKNEKQTAIIDKIHEIIDQDYMKHELSVDSIAGTLGMSTPHMSKLYKQYTMHTVLEDIILMRMRKARELLLFNDQSVQDISAKVGFANSTYFYKAFKQVNGVTPTEYRKNFR